tara:strand:+ start:975 stop:1883 length:909 start_codon:yes stop_codon:yes gene_type:complete
MSMQWVTAACPLCRSEKKDIVFAGNIDKDDILKLDPADYACTSNALARYVDIVKCEDCGIVYLKYRPSEEILTRLIGSVLDDKYLMEEKGRHKTFSRVLSDVNQLNPKKGKMLEIGSYTGVFLKMARKSGWHVLGVEPCVWAREISLKNHNLDILPSINDLDKHVSSSFDFIAMWDVIEHLVDPGDVLNKISRLLKPGGGLGISTIMLDSIAAKLLGKRYPFLMQMHLVYFTRETLNRELNKRGFDVLRNKRHRRYVSYDYLFGKFTILNRLKKIPFLKNILKKYYFVSSVGLRDVYSKKIK